MSKSSYVLILCMLCLCVGSTKVEGAPQLKSAAITAINGTDADQDGYYETLSFEFELAVDSEEGADYDVAARIYCTTTNQGWHTETWNVAGSTSGKVFVVFDHSDFILSGVHDLDFTAELWDATFSTNHSTTNTVQGEPVKAETSAPEPPSGQAPPPPTLASPTTTTITLSANSNGGPADTSYSVRCVVADPYDSKWSGSYVWPFEGEGLRFDVPVWRKLSLFQNLPTTRLQPGTTYTFTVRTRYDGVESPDSAPASITTLTDAQVAAPSAPLLTNPTENSMILFVVGNGGPAQTEYSVRCTSTAPLDTTWNGEYAVTAAGGNGHASEPFWATEAEWQNLSITGLQPSTTYTFAVRARYGGIESTDGPASSLTTATSGQTSLPVPVLTNPTKESMILSVVPNGLPAGASYWVRCIGTKPLDSFWEGEYVWPLDGRGLRFDVPVWRALAEWQALPMTDLEPGTTYTFLVRARVDGVESDGWQASLSTLQDVSSVFTVLAVSGTTISLRFEAAGSSDTFFAIQCTATAPADSSYDQQWVDQCGIASAEPVWLTAQQWSELFAAGLIPLTTYTFAAQVKTPDGKITATGLPVSARTSILGDVTGDCRVNILDLISIAERFNKSTCSDATAAADVNGDGKVNIIDMVVCRGRLYERCPEE